MGAEQDLSRQKYCALAGAFLLLVPTAVTFYWGNIVVYADSYYKEHFGPQSGFKTPWLISFYILTRALGMQLFYPVSERIGHPLTRFLSAAVFELGMFTSYWTCQTSVEALDVTMGGVTGLSSGFLYAETLYIAVNWATKNAGFVSTAVTAGLQTGPIIINEFIALYINPHNERPDLKMGPKRFFSQPEILKRVPILFIILGFFALIIHTISMVLILDKDHDEHDVEKDSKGNSDSPKDHSDSDNLTPSALLSPATHSTPIASSKKNKTLFDETGYLSADESFDEESTLSDFRTSYFTFPNSGYGTLNGSINGQALGETLYSSVEEQGTEKQTQIKPNKVFPTNKEYTPKQMLSTVPFYTLWFNNFGADCAFLVMGNYYKTFGQLWIKDDHFLSNIGISVSVSMIALKLVCGSFMDTCDIKLSMVFFKSLLTVLTAFWFFTAEINRWLYFIVTTALGCAITGVYTSTCVGALKMFGKTYYPTNFGLVTSSNIALNLLAPPIVVYILHTFGWSWLFFTAASVNAIGLLLTAITFPQV